jgi:prophage antirepressor-like protein
VGDKCFAVVSEDRAEYVYIHVRTLAEALNVTAKAIRVEGTKCAGAFWIRPGERLSRDKLPPESYLSFNAAESIREKMNRSAESGPWLSMRAAWGRALDTCLSPSETTLSASDALKSEADTLWRRLAEIEKAMDEAKAKSMADAAQKMATEDIDAVSDVSVSDFDGTPIVTFVWHVRRWCLLADLAKALAPTNTTVRARFFEADVPPNSCASLSRRRTLELRAVLGEQRPIPPEAHALALVAHAAVEQHVTAAITRTGHLSGGVDPERGRRFLAWWKGEEVTVQAEPQDEPRATLASQPETPPDIRDASLNAPQVDPPDATQVDPRTDQHGISNVVVVSYPMAGKRVGILTLSVDGQTWACGRDLGLVLGPKSKETRDWMGRRAEHQDKYRTISGEGYRYILAHAPNGYVETSRRRRLSFLSPDGVRLMCSIVKGDESEKLSAWWTKYLEGGLPEPTDQAEQPQPTSPLHPDISDVVYRTFGKYAVTTFRWKGEPAVVGRHVTRALGYHGDPLSGSSNADRVFLTADTSALLNAYSCGRPVSVFNEKILTRLATRKGNYHEPATKFLAWWRECFGLRPAPPPEPLINAISTQSGVTVVSLAALANGLETTPEAIREHVANIVADGGLKVAPTGDYLDATAAHAVLIEHGGAIARRFGKSLAQAFMAYEGE